MSIVEKLNNKGQYLSEDSLRTVDTSGDYELVSTDSYNEKLIMESIKKVNQQQCYALSLQFAVVGMGNKSYGKVIISGVEYSCSDLAKANGVKIGNRLNDKLAPGELTIKRLSRFFRYQIRDYIRQTSNSSYLYRKYCNDNDADPSLVFPGAEHMVEGNDALILLKAYSDVDSKLQTKFLERIRRVYQARGISIKLQEQKI